MQFGFAYSRGIKFDISYDITSWCFQFYPIWVGWRWRHSSSVVGHHWSSTHLYFINTLQDNNKKQHVDKSVKVLATCPRCVDQNTIFKMCLRPSYYQMAVTDSQRKTFGNHLHKIVARIVSITTSANGELCLICLFFNVCMQHDGKRVIEFSLKFHDRSKMIRRKFLWQIADHPLNLGFFFLQFWATLATSSHAPQTRRVEGLCSGSASCWPW